MPNSPAYDITASPAVTGTIIPCIKVSNVFSQTQFAKLRLLHGEGGALVDRTVLPNNYQTREIEGSVASLSPFVIAEQLSPTSALVSVGGRVLTAKGRGVSKAFITLTDPAGESRSAVTNPFGYYRFENLPVGQAYILTVRSKRYTFDPNIRVISLLEELTGEDFTASP